MRYGLYPWTWDSEQQEHRPPDGAVCCLDLRPLPEQAKQEQSGGWGFFAWNGGGDPPSDVISLGDGDCRSLQPTTSQRDELRLRLGLSANPQGATLVDVIGDVLGSLADPTGQARPKPLMPIAGIGYEIHLASHSRVWQLDYDPRETLAASPRGRANKVRDVIRATIAEARRNGGPELAAKVLGDVLRRHGYTKQEVDEGASGKRAEWARLIRPADLAAMGGAAFKPKRPQTSYTDDFNRSDASSLGAGWSSYLASAEYGISGNKCIGGKAATWGSSVIESARYDSDVSSADHWTQATITSYDVSGSDSWLGAMSRFSSSAHTGYFWAHVSRSYALSNRLSKVVSGTETTLSTPNMTNASGDVVQCRCSGSTISGRTNGVEKASVTDTSITGNTRGGLVYRSVYYAYRPYWDDWSIDDGVVAGGQSMAQRTGTTSRRGWNRVGRSV